MSDAIAALDPGGLPAPGEKTLWLYWEDLPGRETPAYIRLCRETVAAACEETTPRFVHPGNVARYLPDLDPRVAKFALKPRGRLEKWFGLAKRRRGAVAQKVDFIRAMLLERYGGFWIDADAILLRDPSPYFDLLTEKSFAITRRESHGRNHVSINFYGTRAGGPVMQAYADAMRARIEDSLEFEWNDLGAAMATPIVDRMIDDVVIIPEAEIQPVTFETAEADFVSTQKNPEDLLRADQIVFMLYNGPFKGALKAWSAEDLYGGDILLSKVFRRALPNGRP